MKTTLRGNVEVFICASVVIAVGILSLWQVNRTNSGQLSHVIVAGYAAPATTVPIVSNPVLKTDTASQPTPDGTKKVVMKTTHNTNSLHYVFTTTDGSGGNVQPLFEETIQASVSATEGMNIPFNSWSPDNKYVFIQKNDGDALVYKVTGEDIIPGQRYLDIKNLFDAAGKKDTYKETTGWASPTLLIINTLSPDNTKGSSYWFEVPSKAIIQLSSSF